jgi:hypothetical protein
VEGGCGPLTPAGAAAQLSLQGPETVPKALAAGQSRGLTHGFRELRRQPPQAIVGCAQLVTDLGQDPHQRRSFGAGARNGDPEGAGDDPPLAERVEEVRRGLVMLPERHGYVGAAGV